MIAEKKDRETGQYLGFLRGMTGIQRRELAKRLGLTYHQIKFIEIGRTPIRDTMRDTYVKALNTEIDAHCVTLAEVRAELDAIAHMPDGPAPEVSL